MDGIRDGLFDYGCLRTMGNLFYEGKKEEKNHILLNNTWIRILIWYCSWYLFTCSCTVAELNGLSLLLPHSLLEPQHLLVLMADVFFFLNPKLTGRQMAITTSNLCCLLSNLHWVAVRHQCCSTKCWWFIYFIINFALGLHFSSWVSDDLTLFPCRLWAARPVCPFRAIWWITSSVWSSSIQI